MGALEPIAGVSLEQYAELCAAMKDCNGDLDVCARIAGERARAQVPAELAPMYLRRPDATVGVGRKRVTPA